VHRAVEKVDAFRMVLETCLVDKDIFEQQYVIAW
jgi:hypothetical protein